MSLLSCVLSVASMRRLSSVKHVAGIWGRFVARSPKAWAGAAVLAMIGSGGLGGCAHLGAPGGPAAPAGAASAPAAANVPVGTPAASAPGARPVAAPAPGQPPAFATVIKDAKQIPGTFTLWQKDDKVWIELAEKDFGAPLFLSPKLASGIGESGIFGGLMARGSSTVGRPQLVEFRRVHNLVQLIGRNTAFVAAAGTPAARAVQAGFSPSLIGSTPVASAPHPERKTVLIEANPLFLGDWLAIGAQLQRAYRQGYGFDGRNSAIVAVRGKPDVVVFEVQNHYATQSIASAQPGSPPGAPVPGTPDTLPDARSLFVKLHYSLSRLPAEPMAVRAADPRIGFFTSTVNDFGDDLARTPKKRFVNRWRLEKKDPAAAL
ncbi:MAG: DUF5117 domain-containing protein, partial [Burkholderiales bacterium]